MEKAPPAGTGGAELRLLIILHKKELRGGTMICEPRTNYIVEGIKKFSCPMEWEMIQTLMNMMGLVAFNTVEEDLQKFKKNIVGIYICEKGRMPVRRYISPLCLFPKVQKSIADELEPEEALYFLLTRQFTPDLKTKYISKYPHLLEYSKIDTTILELCASEFATNRVRIECGGDNYDE